MWHSLLIAVSANITYIVVSLATVIVAPLLAYIGVTRKLSGKISTSEASDLWKESKAIREDYRIDNDRLRNRITDLEGRILKYENDTIELKRDNLQLVEQILTLKDKIRDLMEINAKLMTENEQLRKRVEVLEVNGNGHTS